MASSSFKYIILVAFMCELQNVFAGTRYLPSIIWDGFNPLLKCKCNWMKITKLTIYDRVELVCPKLFLVSALRKEDISKANVFYNMYIRKFNISASNSLDELEKLLYNDAFCDPTKSKRLHSCVRKDPTEAYKLRIHSDDDHQEGDISVIFSNSDTGKESDAKSNRTKCAMVFVINVTSSGAEEYDMSYGKCLHGCLNTNNTCPCDSSKKDGGIEIDTSTTTSPSTHHGSTTTRVIKSTNGFITPRSPSSRKSSTRPIGSTKLESPIRPTVPINSENTSSPTSCTGSDCRPKKSGRSGMADGGDFKPWVFIVGMIVGIAITVAVISVAWIYLGRNKKVMSCITRSQEVEKREEYPNPAFRLTTPTAPNPPIDTPDGDHLPCKEPRSLDGVSPAVGISEKPPMSEWRDNPYENAP